MSKFFKKISSVFVALLLVTMISSVEATATGQQQRHVEENVEGRQQGRDEAVNQDLKKNDAKDAVKDAAKRDRVKEAVDADVGDKELTAPAK